MHREVAVVFVEQKYLCGRDADACPAHVPIRLARLHQDAVESDCVFTNVPANAREVDLERLKWVPGNPVARQLWLKFRDYVDGQVEPRHLPYLVDKLVDQVS